MDKTTFFSFWMGVYDECLIKTPFVNGNKEEYEKFVFDYISAEGQNYYHSVILGGK